MKGERALRGGGGGAPTARQACASAHPCSQGRHRARCRRRRSSHRPRQGAPLGSPAPPAARSCKCQGGGRGSMDGVGQRPPATTACRCVSAGAGPPPSAPMAHSTVLLPLVVDQAVAQTALPGRGTDQVGSVAYCSTGASALSASMATSHVAFSLGLRKPRHGCPGSAAGGAGKGLRHQAPAA